LAEGARPQGPGSLRVASLLLVLLALLPPALSLATKRQLFTLGGLTDNWIYLGANLRVSGVLGEERLPMVLRAPGYPLFVAGVLGVALEKPPSVTDAYMLRGAMAVYAPQAILLAVSGLLLFLWLSDLVARTTAFVAGLVLATGPYSVVLVGLVHYSVLHLFLLVAGGLALHRLLSTSTPSRAAVCATGLLWGCATLVRSTTLILPVFVLALFFLRSRDLRQSLRRTALFTAGMCLVIAPATIRNYRVAHRFVAVNLQAGAAVWGSTVKPLPADPDSYRWYEVSDEFMRIYSRVTGQPQYDYVLYAPHHVQMEDEMRREALANLRRDPRPYLTNALRTLGMLCLDTSSILIRVFQHSQPPRPWVDQFWFRADAPRDALPAVPARGYVRLGSVLTALAGIGLLLAIWRRDVLALVPAALFFCLVAAHALTYMDVLYHYVRPPFVTFLAFYAVDALGRLAPPLARPAATAAARVLALLLGAASLVLTAQLLST
jgi:hypothetical protein